MVEETTRVEGKPCSAVTKSGEPCKNRAQRDSDYCYVHRMVVAESTSGQVISGTVKIFESPSPVIEGAAAPAARSVVQRETDQQIEILLAELNALAKELQRSMPVHVPPPPPLTPAQLMELFNQSIGRLAPGPQRELLEDIQHNLQDVTYRDLLDPETLKGLWYILSYSAQSQSAALKENVEAALVALPGYSLLSNLKGNLEGTSPGDLMDPETWKGMWLVMSYAAQAQVQEAKRRLLGQGDDEEETQQR
jgi:hypothetical protein